MVTLGLRRFPWMCNPIQTFHNLAWIVYIQQFACFTSWPWWPDKAYYTVIRLALPCWICGCASEGTSGVKMTWVRNSCSVTDAMGHGCIQNDSNELK